MTTFYSTKDALKTNKIQELQGEIPEGLPQFVVVQDEPNAPFYLKLGKDVHQLKSNALDRANLLRERKIKFFQKQIDKLNNLNFEEE